MRRPLGRDTLDAVDKALASEAAVLNFKKDTSAHFVGVHVDIEASPQPEQIMDLTEHPVIQQIKNMNESFTRQQQETAMSCIRRAEELEAAARDLRDKAAIIHHQSTQIPDDLLNAVKMEIETRNRVLALALVNPNLEDT